VNRIEITAKGFEIDFHVGAMYLRKELGAKTPGSLGFGQAEPTDLFLKTGGSRRLTNGGGYGSCPRIFFSTSLKRQWRNFSKS